MFDGRQLNQYYRSSFPCVGQGSNILLPDEDRRIQEDEGNDRFLFDIVGFGGANIFSSGQHSAFIDPLNHSIFLPDVVVDTNNSARTVSEVVSAEDRFGFFLQLDFRNFSMKRAHSTRAHRANFQNFHLFIGRQYSSKLISDFHD